MIKSEARAQAFFTEFCISDGCGMAEASRAMDESCSLWTCPDANCFSSICVMGGLLSGLFRQVSHQRGIPKLSPVED